MAGACVFDALVGVEKVVADLRAEAGFGLRAVLGSLLSFLLFFLQASQARTEHLAGQRSVLMLAALVLALDDDAGRHVRQADGACRFVDVLAAGAAGGE